MSSKSKDLMEISDFNQKEIEKIFKLAKDLKKNPIKKTLKNKVIGLIFSKSSTRTRVSFEVGIHQLGGSSLFLSPSDIQLGRGETLQDTSKVLSRYLDGIIIRTFEHNDIIEIANNADIPIINGLTDLAHPCQVLTDLFTIIEKLKTYKNKKIVYLGDCNNNMAYSWTNAAQILGLKLCFSGHEDYLPNLNSFKNNNIKTHKNTKIEIIKDPFVAIKNADVIYTDVWTSMGQEKESLKRRKSLLPWQINSKLIKSANKKSIFMHCLPAHREEEVTSEVLDSEISVVFDQAENRLHVQKAILTYLFNSHKI